MSNTTLTLRVHSTLDPACYLYRGARVPDWVRRLLGWNCNTCRTCDGHTHMMFSRCWNGLTIGEYLCRSSADLRRRARQDNEASMHDGKET